VYAVKSEEEKHIFVYWLACYVTMCVFAEPLIAVYWCRLTD